MVYTLVRGNVTPRSSVGGYCSVGELSAAYVRNEVSRLKGGCMESSKYEMFFFKME